MRKPQIQISHLLKLTVILRLCRDAQQLFFVFLDLLLETNILLTDHGLQLPQLRTTTRQGPSEGAFGFNT